MEMKELLALKKAKKLEVEELFLTVLEKLETIYHINAISPQYFKDDREEKSKLVLKLEKLTSKQKNLKAIKLFIKILSNDEMTVSALIACTYILINSYNIYLAKKTIDYAYMICKHNQKSVVEIKEIYDKLTKKAFD